VLRTYLNLQNLSLYAIIYDRDRHITADGYAMSWRVSITGEMEIFFKNDVMFDDTYNEGLPKSYMCTTVFSPNFE